MAELFEETKNSENKQAVKKRFMAEMKHVDKQIDGLSKKLKDMDLK
jgi:arylsulfatase A-like enzyme